MPSGSLVLPVSRAPAALQPPPSIEAMVADRAGETAEINRWAILLGIPFVLASLFFMAMLATGEAWLVAGSLVTGPGLLIAAVIYLSLSSDSNSG